MEDDGPPETKYDWTRGNKDKLANWELQIIIEELNRYATNI